MTTMVLPSKGLPASCTASDPWFSIPTFTTPNDVLIIVAIAQYGCIPTGLNQVDLGMGCGSCGHVGSASHHPVDNWVCSASRTGCT